MMDLRGQLLELVIDSGFDSDIFFDDVLAIAEEAARLGAEYRRGDCANRGCMWCSEQRKTGARALELL